MAHTHGYFFYGNDTAARDAFLEKARDELAPSFTWWFGKEKSVGIDDIRDMIKKSALSAAGGAQVFIVLGADRMTKEAEEALLKLLEEPPAGSLFFLVADSVEVPATLRSRLTLKAFFLRSAQGVVAAFEEQVRVHEHVSTEEFNRLGRMLRLEKLRGTARISAQSLVEYEQICLE